ncbi:MAG: BspA family leucine-rich repeat surface protein [Bacilli bacterium]|nr:BspA family leucine-rich repeat surface protein [Bacilli bacterium]
MKKKEGFTLIELLAVIVILAVNALIATPLIMNIISEAKKGAFLDSSYAIITAAEQGYAKSLIKEIDAEETEYTFNDGVKALKSGNITLEYKGSNPNYGNLIINDEGNVSINFYSNGWCATKNYDTDVITIDAVSNIEDCVPDIVAPVITLEDGDITILSSQENYVEPGYSAIDETDGDITTSVIISHNIQYGVSGEYTITYTVADLSGNTSTLTRNVKVINDPILMVASSSGNDTANFLGGPLIKNTIESIIFDITNVVPSSVIGSWDVSKNQDGSVMAWYTDNDSDGLYELTIGGYTKVYANPNSNYLFSSLTSLKTINFANFDTSMATSMSRMFYASSGLTSLNLSTFNTSNVLNMSYMFDHAYNISSMNLSNFDTSKVTTMYGMFQYMTNLRSLDLRSFDTSKVINMGYMFYDCSKLTSLNLSSFNTSNVTNMTDMFNMNRKLTSLDLSSFDTSKVTNMYRMFYYTDVLTTLDIRNFTFDSVTNSTQMFLLINSSAQIYTKNSTTRTFILSALSEVSRTSCTVTIAS